MQFSNFSRLQEGSTITLYNEIPIENVGVIKYYKDGIPVNDPRFSKKEFRWSFNNVYWSAWENLTQSAISSIKTLGNYFFFLQVRYVQATAGANVTSFTLNYEEGNAIKCVPCTGDVIPILTEDIQHSDASSMVIHDILQQYKIVYIKDASLLNGYPGSWYLDRSHHTGKQPISSIVGLQAILNNLSQTGTTLTPRNIDASGIGVFDHRDGSIWYFKTIFGGKNIFVSTDSSGAILIDASISDAAYLKEASIGSGFVWNNGMLDVSAIGAQGVQGTYLNLSSIDGSTVDISIGYPTPQIYGTYYQLSEDLTTTSSNSTSPQTKVTLVTPNLPLGTYKITAHWLWSRNTASNSARFDITLNGTSQGTRSTMEMEAGDTTDIRPETRIFYRTISGINTILLRYWGESTGNSTSISDASLEIIRVS